jgi:hypothetical protein
MAKHVMCSLYSCGRSCSSASPVIGGCTRLNSCCFWMQTASAESAQLTPTPLLLFLSVPAVANRSLHTAATHGLATTCPGTQRPGLATNSSSTLGTSTTSVLPRNLLGRVPHTARNRSSTVFSNSNDACLATGPQRHSLPPAVACRGINMLINHCRWGTCSSSTAAPSHLLRPKPVQAGAQ